MKRLLFIAVLLLAGRVWGATFGYDGDASSNGGMSITAAEANVVDIYTASAGDVITELSVYILTYSTSRTVDVGVYTFVGGVPVTRVGYATITANTAAYAWTSITGLSIALTDGVTYCLAYGNVSGTCRIARTSVTNGRSTDGNQATLPATWAQTAVANYRIGLRATYTEGGGEPPTATARHFMIR